MKKKKIVKRQKPIEHDIHLKYKCPTCDQHHWLAFREAKTKNFKVVCSCKTTFSPVQINKFKNEQKKLEETNKKYKSLADYNNSLPFASLPYEAELMKKDETLKEKRESWFETLSKDVYVEEAIHILDDLNQKPDTKKGFTSRSNKMIKS